VTGREPPDSGEPDHVELIEQFAAAISGLELDDLRAMAGQILAAADVGFGRPRRGPSRSLRKPTRPQPATYRIRIVLDESEPLIWRLLDVRSDVGLDRLHQYIQAAFGWEDYHLYRFSIGGEPFEDGAEAFACPADLAEEPDDAVLDSEVRLDETLADPGDVMHYVYDYGDYWAVTISLDEVRPLDPDGPPAVCVDGRQAAPPEDCGSLRTAEELAEVLDDPSHFDVADVNAALRDPYLLLEEQGIAPRLVQLLMRLRGLPAADELTARLAALPADPSPWPSPDERAAALHAITWFLDRVGDGGLALTSAGYLKPVDVQATAEVLPTTIPWIGKNNREVQTGPVLWFRESLQRTGLVRKSRGRLLLTKAGAKARRDPEVLWQHLAQRLLPGREDTFEGEATPLALAWIATSEHGDVDAAALAEMLAALGWRVVGPNAEHMQLAWAVDECIGLLDNVTTTRRDRSTPRRFSPQAIALAREVVRPS